MRAWALGRDAYDSPHTHETLEPRSELTSWEAPGTVMPGLPQLLSIPFEQDFPTGAERVNPSLLAIPGLVGFWFSSGSARSQLRAKSCNSHSAPGGM